MKTLLIICTLMVSITVNSQLSIGGGWGWGDKTKFMAQVSLNWNIAHFGGIDGGFSSTLSSNKPAFFHLQGYAPIINNEKWKVSPMAGYSYKLLNAENKTEGVNSGSWIASLEAANNMNNRGVVYSRISYTQKYTWITFGIRGFLGRRDYCY